MELAGYLSLGDAFAARVAEQPDRTALTVLRGSTAAEDESLSFAELDRRARLRAADLAGRLAPGERVLIALPTCTEFVELYLACLYAGLIAVPAPVPGGSAAAAERVAAIAGDCAPGLTVTTEADLEAVAEQMRGRGVGELPVEAVREAGSDRPGMPGDRRPGPETIAVLQYSSGSTGSPKGVALTHGGILANLAAEGIHLGVGPADRFGIWLPLHHDMGLFGQLSAALMHGARTVLMPPTQFVRRPVEWFRMMDRYRITVTAGPDFAYELCARVIPDEALAGLDLSCLRYAFNGSEPIHPPTARAFTERFARIGLGPGVLSPAYGLAESTAYVSATGGLVAPTVLDADRSRLEDGVAPELASATDGESRPVISVGRVEAFDTVIVDPRTRRALPAGRVGEIWLRGPGIGAGYWNKPELSARIFAARLAEPVAAERGVAGAVSGEPRVADPVAAQRGVAGAEPEERGWLRTGDLGAMVGGELFVTGRLKELLIVNGRNLAPQDVEKEARAAHDALGGQIGAAFGVAAPDERIVLVHEVDPRTPRAELPAVAGAVTRRLSRSFGIPLRNVVLVRRGTVRRTTSGKIRRTAMRDRFLAGEITALHADLEPAVRAVPAGS